GRRRLAVDHPEVPHDALNAVEMSSNISLLESAVAPGLSEQRNDPLSGCRVADAVGERRNRPVGRARERDQPWRVGPGQRLTDPVEVLIAGEGIAAERQQHLAYVAGVEIDVVLAGPDYLLEKNIGEP